VEVLIFEDGGLVLTKRCIEPYMGMWHIPGGTVYFGESVEDATMRVAKDELGVGVEVLGFQGVIEYPNHSREEIGFDHPVGLAMECRRVSGEYVGSSEGIEIEVFEKLPENMIEDQRFFLRNKKGRLV
jgi:ADP-ribose pyrophosphatase YjhB (NUDIX family)